MAYHYDRAFYRLVYPMTLRPRLRIGPLNYEVVDLSEQGIRFIHAGPESPGVGMELAGRLRLPTGEVLDIEGTVVRVTLPSVALTLSKGVPFGVMIEQQRYISQRKFASI